MKYIKIMMYICLSSSLLLAVDDAVVAPKEQEQDIIVAQMREPAEQVPAQKAVFVGIEKLEPELLRTALVALTARGQKVSAIGVVEALERVRDRCNKAIMWPALAATSYLLYGVGSSFLELNRPGGGERFFKSYFSFMTVFCVSAFIVQKHAKLGRISELIDVLVHADDTLDFGDSMQKFIQRLIILQQSVDSSDAKMTNLRLALVDMESHHAPSHYE